MKVRRIINGRVPCVRDDFEDFRRVNKGRDWTYRLAERFGEFFDEIETLSLDCRILQRAWTASLTAPKKIRRIRPEICKSYNVRE